MFRLTTASWYGPGLFGGRLACTKKKLRSKTLGVAHRTLRCGTRVTLRNGGRTIRVRVIDRGPYHDDREFDLTAATARRIGFVGIGPIWVAHG